MLIIINPERKVTDIGDELFKMTATEAVGLLRSKEVSPLDLVERQLSELDCGS